MPAYTLFSKYEPCVFYELNIKMNTIGDDDFVYQPIAQSVALHGDKDFYSTLDAALNNGESLNVDLDCFSRDGEFKKHQVFAVWELNDLVGLVEILNKCGFVALGSIIEKEAENETTKND